ncbi:MAG: type II toxin-antitoxin system RelE/ParE family toxin [Nitrospirae bacterium]|nr:type II toxin-antitoxin system RelE/ParE family toxin [Nitrospirota bacterium]
MGWYRVTYLFLVILVIDDLRETEIVMAQRLFDKTKWLASNAENLRHEPLGQDLPGLAQYPVGDWRILYSIDREDHVVDIHRIGTRGDLYRSRSAQKKS